VNLILENSTQVPYFTNMRLVLEALRVPATTYDWYVSDIETNVGDAIFSVEDRWLSGEELGEALAKHEIQFCWAVFSAVPKGCRPSVSSTPYADGNPSYWNERELKPQLVDAYFEIACWDSSATIVVGITQEAATSFIRMFSDAIPLSSSASCSGA
jgi:hypothetical protein